MAYNFYNMGIIGSEIKRRLDLLTNIEGDNGVVSTNELTQEVSDLTEAINNETINRKAQMNATINTVNENVKQALNINKGISLLDAGNIVDFSESEDESDITTDIFETEDYNITEQITALRNQIESILTSTGGNASSLNDAIDYKIDLVNLALTQLNTEVDELEEGLSIVSRNADKAISDAVTNKSNITTVDTKYNEHVTTLTNQMNDIYSRISKVRDDIIRINSRVDNINNIDLKSLEAQIALVDTNFKIHEAKVADYIIEEGTKNDWTYRKWNSGLAECEKVIHTTLTTNKEVNNGETVFVSASSEITFPSDLFVKSPACTFSVASAGYPVPTLHTLHKNFIRLWFLTQWALKNQNATICIIAKGQWK